MARPGIEQLVTRLLDHRLLTDQRRIQLQGTMTLRLTPNWQLQYTSRLDLQTREVVTADLSITRDLHCWEGQFRWSPMGLSQGFYLRIGIRESQLRDVQLEQRRGAGTFGGFR